MKPEGQRQCFLELHTPPFRQVSGQTTEENERERGGRGQGGIDESNHRRKKRATKEHNDIAMK